MVIFQVLSTCVIMASMTHDQMTEFFRDGAVLNLSKRAFLSRLALAHHEGLLDELIREAYQNHRDLVDLAEQASAVRLRRLSRDCPEA